MFEAKDRTVSTVRFEGMGPKGKAKSYHEIGRAIATLMSDEVLYYLC